MKRKVLQEGYYPKVEILSMIEGYLFSGIKNNAHCPDK